MTLYLGAAAIVVLAYLIGSIPVGVVFAARRGVDIRAVGSGNIGATNVARTLGKRLGAVVLVLDALKGAAPIALVYLLDLDARVDPFVVALAGTAAICGHCFPVWLRFRGGKGVATSLGVFVAVDPLVAGAAVAVFAAIYALTRIASVGSIVAAVALAALLWLLGRPDEIVTLGIAGAAIILVQHRGNLRRLLRREELQV